MMNYSKAQMSSLSEEAAGGPQSSPAGVKLGAVMEHLQRQQEAKMEMNLQEKHLLQAQLLFAKQAAAARASGSRQDSALFGKANPRSRMDPEEEDDDGEETDEEDLDLLAPEENHEEKEEEEDEEVEDNEEQAKRPQLQQALRFPFKPFSSSPTAAREQMSEFPPSAVKQEHEEKNLMSHVGQHGITSPGDFADWSFDEHLKQRGGAVWAEEGDGGKVRGEPSRDFAKLYELDNDPQRKEFLDELFVFMQKRGTPVNRIPIMAKQVLDLYRLFKLVTEKGGLVEVINKKIWREITKGLNLPTSITSAAFTLRTQYMKYLYPFECEKKGLSSPGELQAAVDSNRREGRRPSYTNSLYRYSSSPSSTPRAILSSPTMQTTPTSHNGFNTSASPNLRRSTEESPTPGIPRLPMALALGQQQQQQQQQQLAQAATLEHLRERLERGAAGASADGPDKKMMRLAEEQQRLMQQALQQNLLAMASQFNPMNLKLNNGHESKQDLSLNISTNGPASISVSVEVNGTMYSGTLFAQKSAAPVSSQTVTLAGTSGFSALSSSHSPSSSSSTSSKGPN
ncbi:AT-rich interactive domain-containing protein 3A-like [Stegastes partitus]|uniref:AT-rich interactive domain-containing protein 3 n=1 Tax=Stegastes partitus TaxID=144197 RepID=A0A9Y4NVR4_9TELE|nr:PREDICTED: AT-rich interactive domain-containing protein 3A-like [Stegastes partitus]